MKLASIRAGETCRAAVVIDDQVIDLAAADPSLPSEMTALLSVPGYQEKVQAVVDSGAERVPVDPKSLAAPVPNPGKFFGIGLNYADHVAESGLPTPEYPVVFAKMSSCVAGPYEDVQRPVVSDAFDYEAELGLVIGKTCKHVKREDAPGVIAGYVVVNDLTIRDYQRKTPQWTLGKSFDTHGPFGPYLVTGDELDPHTLDLKATVNGEVRQHSNTKNLIFDCYELVETLTEIVTLEPGDVIATGTCGGVGLAFDPPRFLVPGDVVRIEIEGIGAIENTVVQEQV
jgi:2-keto-4-pentenoate hydratase/2-oxohepta-3-ene-1,7-dioic acid hydratase in catechol pathway